MNVFFEVKVAEIPIELRGVDAIDFLRQLRTRKINVEHLEKRLGLEPEPAAVAGLLHSMTVAEKFTRELARYRARAFDAFPPSSARSSHQILPLIESSAKPAAPDLPSSLH